jgi:OOP family OmpA-OmpF porin
MWIKTRLPLAALPLLALLSGSASAENGFYAFGIAGTSRVDTTYDIFNSVDDDQTGFSVGVGFALNQNFSIEAAYLDFGTHRAQTDCPPDLLCLVVPAPARADLSGYSVSLIGSIPLGERWALYGKAGLASWDIQYRGLASAFDRSNNDLLLGAGLQWTWNDRWKLFAEYFGADDELGFAGLGARYRF